MPKIKRALASFGVGALLAGGLVVANVETASAASTYITVCNSSLSHTYIEVKPTGGVKGPGSCALPLLNSSNQVRVDTDWTGSSHSYKINPVGGPVGPCHTNSDNHNSDPPNYATVYYQNFDHGDCTN